MNQIGHASENMNNPVLIQGGMGVGVSGWRLAKTVSLLGHLGVVSGTALNTVLIRRLQDGDFQGNVRRALAHFPDQAVTGEILRTYWREGGRPPRRGYKRSPLPSIEASPFLQRLNVVASFVEVFLGKENHAGQVGINFLEKLQTSNLPAIYGAMLAGVDYVLMGAGVPREIPGVLDLFQMNRAASLKITLFNTTSSGADVHTHFDPSQISREINGFNLKRPKFLAIISSATLAIHLARKSTGKVDGFIVEGPLAGGHNAPPRGPLKLNDGGEPIYGDKDDADLESIRSLGIPFWLAGDFGSPERLKEALDMGAAGIQVGTAFAFCNESGLAESLRKAVIGKWCLNEDQVAETVFTDPFASPTGFPFKVVPLAETLSQGLLYEVRPRKCDLGYLRQVTRDSGGEISYRCPAEPVADYIKKGGKLEDTVNRKCLCNALLSNIGMSQVQNGDYEELPLLTAGDSLAQLKRYLPEGKNSYSAADVISYLIGGNHQ